MQHQRASLDVLVFLLAVRLVAAAGDLPPVRERHGKAELLCFRRMNIEKLHGSADNLALFAIFDLDEEEALVDKFQLLRRQKHLGKLMQNPDDLLVGIEPRFSVIFAARHSSGRSSAASDDAEQMIDVLVCDDDIAHILPLVACVLQPAQQQIAAAAVDQKATPRLLHDKAGVVAGGCLRVSVPRNVIFIALFLSCRRKHGFSAPS